MRLTTLAGEGELRPHALVLRTPSMPLNTASIVLIGERAHRFHFLNPQNVDYFEVDGNYVTMHVGEECYLTRTTLKRLAELLLDDFVHIDRSRLVNLRQVDYVERMESGRFAFKLRQGAQLISSRARASRIAQLLHSGVR